MKKLIRRYIDFLHLKREQIKDVDIKNYEQVSDIKLAERHLLYLKEMHSYQRDRQNNIENKNSQLVGQASIIVSIIALFIPLLIDKLADLNTTLLVILIIAFLIILFHYIVTIVHSIKTLQINHYKYSFRSTTSLTKADRDSSEIDFLKSEIEDLIWCIDKNNIQNNRKANNLIYATRSFRIASISLVIFTLIVIGFSTTLTKPPSKISVESIHDSVTTKIYSPITEEIKQLSNHNQLDKINSNLNKLNRQMDSLNTTIATISDSTECCKKSTKDSI